MTDDIFSSFGNTIFCLFGEKSITKEQFKKFLQSKSSVGMSLAQ